MTGTVTIKGSYGENVINNNTTYGLIIAAGSTVYLDRISAVRNGLAGIYITHAVSKSGTVTGKRLTLIENGMQGIFMDVDGAVLLDKVNALYNGINADYDGVWVTTNVNPVTIKNSVSIGNTASGFDLQVSGAVVTLYNTIYAGNDSNNSGGELDLYIH